MKKDAEQVNIWYSPHTKLWMTCAWVPHDPYDGYYGGKTVVYSKDRHAHTSFEVAVDFIKENYAGSTK